MIGRPNFKQRRGFSLIEMMVVIAIIAVLIIASLPLFREFSRARNLRSGANIVVSTLRTTRGKAITHRTNHRMVIDTINQAVSIYRSGDTPVEKWRRLPDFVRFDPPIVSHIEFEPRGNLSGVAVPPNRQIVIREESTGDTRIIEVNVLTGRIRIE